MKRNENIGAADSFWAKYGIFIVCGIYLVISAVLFMMMTGGKVVISPDTMSYTNPAQHLLRNRFFSADGVNPEYSRTPGYPLFLALVYLFGGTELAVIVVQILLMAVKIFLFYRVLLLLFTPWKIALFGSALLLVNVPSYGYSFAILSEPLFGFLLMLALFFFVKYLVSEKKSMWLFFAFSITLNFALLTRPILLYFNLLLCPALLILALLRKTSVKCAALFVLCFAAAFGGWSFRNYVHSSVFIYTTINNNDAANLQTPLLEAYLTNVPEEDIDSVSGYVKGVSEANREKLLREYPALEGDELNAAQKSLLRGEYGFGFIKSHFGGFIMASLRGFCKQMFTAFGTSLLFKSTGMSKIAILVRLVQVCLVIFLCVTYLVFFAGFIIDPRQNTAAHVAILLVCAYLSLPGAIYATPRFRDPFFPLLLLSAVNRLPALAAFIRGLHEKISRGGRGDE